MVAWEHMATLYRSTWLELQANPSVFWNSTGEIEKHQGFTGNGIWPFTSLFLQNWVYLLRVRSARAWQNSPFWWKPLFPQISCVQTLSKEAWPVWKLHSSLAGACCDSMRQNNIKLRTLRWTTLGNSLPAQVRICPKVSISGCIFVYPASIFDFWLKNCQRCNLTSSVANLWGPNRTEAAWPSCPTSISACSSAAPELVCPCRSACQSGWK